MSKYNAHTRNATQRKAQGSRQEVCFNTGVRVTASDQSALGWRVLHPCQAPWGTLLPRDLDNLVGCSVTQETIHLIETAIVCAAEAKPAPAPSNWVTRKLLPEFEAALELGAFSGGTDSTQITSDESDARPRRFGHTAPQ
jgi:hypothetical protein